MRRPIPIGVLMLALLAACTPFPSTTRPEELAAEVGAAAMKIREGCYREAVELRAMCRAAGGRECAPTAGLAYETCMSSVMFLIDRAEAFNEALGADGG